MAHGLEEIRKTMEASTSDSIKKHLQDYLDKAEAKEREAAERLANMTESERQSLREEQAKQARELEAQKKWQEEQDWRNKLRRAGIPRRFYGANIEEIAPEIRGLCEGQEGLFLHGSAGTGKTHLAVALLKHRGLDRGSFTTVPGLLLEIRSSFKDHAECSEESIIDHYSAAKPLVMDDLGVEKASEFAMQTLYLIIDHRYANLNPPIITSNLSLGEIANKVGDRIASRIAEMCKIIELKGKDRRLG